MKEYEISVKSIDQRYVMTSKIPRGSKGIIGRAGGLLQLPEWLHDKGISKEHLWLQFYEQRVAVKNMSDFGVSEYYNPDTQRVTMIVLSEEPIHERLNPETKWKKGQMKTFDFSGKWPYLLLGIPDFRHSEGVRPYVNIEIRSI